MENISRRKFFATSLGGLTTAAIGVITYATYRYLAPLQISGEQGKASISSSEITTEKAKFFEFRNSTAVVIKTKTGELLAFSAVCTHLGCIVQWEKERQDFLCPCHAGRYDSSGRVTAGPPPRALERLPLKVSGETITIG